VADIFLGEFMRLFKHFQTRNERNRMSKKQAKKDRYLAPNASWTKPYYDATTQEYQERLLFS
jgi:hypothetical protein